MSGELVVRGSKIRSDDQGRVSLNDIHAAAKGPKGKERWRWTKLPTAKELVSAVLEKTHGKSVGASKNYNKSVLYAKGGIGTFADPVIALAYAKYLSPELHIEVNEVFLRYKAADITLADEVLTRASVEDAEWLQKRAQGKVQRSKFTSCLGKHGVK